MINTNKSSFSDISENSRKLYVADLANDVHCNFTPEALMNTLSSYEASYWLEQTSYKFLIWKEVISVTVTESEILPNRT